MACTGCLAVIQLTLPDESFQQPIAAVLEINKFNANQVLILGQPACNDYPAARIEFRTVFIHAG
jgi:hypothetical protein